MTKQTHVKAAQKPKHSFVQLSQVSQFYGQPNHYTYRSHEAQVFNMLFVPNREARGALRPRHR